MSSDGYAGISLAGRWECGSCGASGDGWWNEQDGFTMDEEHVCGDDETECRDRDGNPYPEHDYDDFECRRCGADPS